MKRLLRRSSPEARHAPIPSVTPPDLRARRGTSTRRIPSVEDIEAVRTALLPSVERSSERIDLNEAGQLALLEELAQFYPSMPFTDEHSPRPSLPVRQCVLFLR